MDYTDVPHTRDSLKKNNVEVIISFLSIIAKETSEAEVDLARTYDSSSTRILTTR